MLNVILIQELFSKIEIMVFTYWEINLKNSSLPISISTDPFFWYTNVWGIGGLAGISNNISCLGI